MDDLVAKYKNLLAEAEDCNLISKLASDKAKRQFFAKLATDPRKAAKDIGEVIGRAASVGASQALA